MGIKTSIRSLRRTKNHKMKFSAALLATVAVADDKKVPPRHPLQRLNRLTEFSAEIMNDWFQFLPSQQNWINKFANNAARMAKNFERGNQRCGFYDENQKPHGGPADDRKRRDTDDEIRYDRENPSVGVKQITTAKSTEWKNGTTNSRRISPTTTTLTMMRKRM